MTPIYKHAYLILAIVAGCAPPPTPSPRLALDWIRPQKRIVLLSPDIRLARRTADDTLQFLPADSTAAQTIFAHTIAQEITARSITAVTLKEADRPLGEQVRRLQALLIAGQDAPGTRANIKETAVLKDTLGPGLRGWADQYGADYAVFLFIRDISTSSARLVVNAATGTMIAVLSLGRVMEPLSDAQRISCLSLIDLYSGDTAWNLCRKDTDGNLTDTDDAAELTQALMQEVPQ